VSAIDPKAFDWPNERACLEQFIEGVSRRVSGRFRDVKRTVSWVKRAGLDAASI
jgi:hypothetical protein